MKNIELLPGFFAQIKKEYGNDRIRNGNFVHAVMADLLPNAIELRRCIKLIYESKAMEYILEIAKEPSLANVQRQKALECLVDFAFMDRQIATVIIDGVLVALYPSVSTAAPPDEVDVPKAKEEQSTEFDILEACFKASEEDIQIKKEEFYEKGQQFYAQQQYIEAVKWYRKAANLGHADAQNDLGVCYHNGNGVTKDLIEAVKWFRKAADQGLAYAQYSLGYCYQNGQGVEKDLTVAEQWYSKAAAQGDEDAQEALEELQAAKAAKLYEAGQSFYERNDFTQAVAYFRKAAEQGYDEAQCHLGYCYEYGWGVTMDWAVAEQWYSKAAAQDHEYAKVALQVLQATEDPQKLYETGKSFRDQHDYEQAVRYFRKAADQGYAAAQYHLGCCYEHGDGVPKKYAEAVEWYRKAAEQGYAASQCELGEYYEYVTKNLTEAVKWYRKAADQGHAVSQYNLGYCYIHGLGVAKDLTAAEQWCSKAADQGHKSAKEALEKLQLAKNPWKLYETGKSFYDRKDYEQAIVYFRKAAERGNEFAEYKLGECYEHGQGVVKDFAEAVKWYRRAAERGNEFAEYKLGECYESGVGVTKDLTEAVKWYLKAAKHRNSEAIEWFRKAADQGDAGAQYILGLLYYKGYIDFEVNLREVVEWFRKAAEQGHIDAQYNLGVCYAKGRGVAKDKTEAVKWFRKAAKQGDVGAKKTLKYRFKRDFEILLDMRTQFNFPA